MGLLASSSSAQLLLHFAYFLLPLSLDAPNTNSVAAAASPFSFSFDFTNTSSYRSDDLTFVGDAGVHGKLVDLTCNSADKIEHYCKGRMSYGQPVPFYDKTTGEVASFSTRFTFAIKFDFNNETRADGMAFFLAYYPSSLPPNSDEGSPGLIECDGITATTAFDERRFVAIEFDTFHNPWDPSDISDHIGIDISSMRSVNTTSLGSFWLNGSMTASITFDNTTRMLVASLQFADNPSIGTFEVSTKLLDPLTLLPSEVAVGLSAATGVSAELHQIMSWSFNSTLAPSQINSTLAPPRINSNLAPPQTGTNHDKKATIIGGSIGGASVSALLVWFIISLRRRSDQYHDLAAQGALDEEPIRPAMDVVERDTPLPDLNVVNTLVSTQQDTYVSSLDLQAPISAGSSSNKDTVIWRLQWTTSPRG